MLLMYLLLPCQLVFPRGGVGQGFIAICAGASGGFFEK
jgi:hypothetical protein